MTVSRLLYCVIDVGTLWRQRWMVRCEGVSAGPFPSLGAASAWAAAEAEAANRLGFAATVRVRVRWLQHRSREASVMPADDIVDDIVDDDIAGALHAVAAGLVGHAHPFTWERADAARHVDPRTLQRALQKNLIAVETNADRTLRLATLTGAGLARLGRRRPPAAVSRPAVRET